MVRNSVCPSTSIQAPYAGAVSSIGCGHWLGICLEGLTTADIDSLYAMMMQLRQRATTVSRTPVAERPAANVSESANVPLLSIGPSGVGGPYQTEI